MNLFKAETGDLSICYIIRAKTQSEAIELANKEYKEYDDQEDPDFLFDSESVTLIPIKDDSEVIESFTVGRFV